MNEKELIAYIRSIGLEVHTSTKARGYQGFYKGKRIDISKDIAHNRVIPTLIHEFTHYIHSCIEPFIIREGGSIEGIFDDDKTNLYEQELLKVTKFVDKSSKCEILLQHKQLIKEKIKECENQIKISYPEFKRSKKFKQFDRYIKTSDAKYLLKYERVKLFTGIIKKQTKIYSITNIETDFADMPKEFIAYIRLRHYQKKQGKISAKINKLNKYYSKPTELFARFVEGLYLDEKTIRELAPNCCKRFYELLKSGYYKELSAIYDLIKNTK